MFYVRFDKINIQGIGNEPRTPIVQDDLFEDYVIMADKENVSIREKDL